MYIAKHMCMVQGKMYQMAEEWKGTGDPPEKYFSLARLRVGPRVPAAPPVVEEKPVTIGEPYEPPPAPPAPPVKPKPVEEMEYFELKKFAKTLGIKAKLKFPELLKVVKEAQAADPG